MSVQEETLSKHDYARLCELIHGEAGIYLGTEKRTMLESRIKRRVKALGMETYGQYCTFLFGKKGMKEEVVSLIDVVTTNKTDFFREPKHFDYLVARALPEMVARAGSGHTFLFWSAGCSTGEEPYTLGIVLSEYAQSHPGFRFHVFASDISTEVLQRASTGVYSEDVVSPVPTALRRKYFMKSRDATSRSMRVVPELRSVVEFRRLNFMDREYGVEEKMDGIFCRNVIIYFNRTTQEHILRKLSHCLQPGGYLFVGHAETLHNMDLPVRPVAPSLYRRVDDED